MDSNKPISYTIRMFLFSLVLIIVFLFFLFISKNNEINCSENISVDIAKKVIIIDAGHGGVDTGANGINGKNESYLCLEISDKIAEILSLSGYQVEMTRTDDNMLSCPNNNLTRKQQDLLGRVNFTNTYIDPCFISIHMNTYPLSSCKGTQIFYSLNNDGSNELASILKENICVLQTDNKRENKSSDKIYVLSKLQCPAVLIECGFLTNQEEELNLNNKEYQNKLALTISQSICQFLESR